MSNSETEIILSENDISLLKEFRYMFIELLKFSKVILEAKSHQNNDIYKNIEHFIKLSSNKKFEDTPRFIEKYLNNLVLMFFNNNKGNILSGVDDISWLSNNNLIIHYGDNLPDEKINSIAMLNIGLLYDSSVSVSNMVKTNKITEEPGSDYPIIFIYKLYQVLYKLKNITNRNRETLLNILVDIENLGQFEIHPYSDIINKNKTVNISNNGGINKMMGLAMNIANSMGITADQDEILKVFNNIDQNPELLSAVDKLGGAATNIISGLQNGGDVIQTISENVLDIIPKDENGESMREQLTNVTEFAKTLDSDRIKQMMQGETNEDKLEALRDIVNSIEAPTKE